MTKFLLILLLLGSKICVGEDQKSVEETERYPLLTYEEFGSLTTERREEYLNVFREFLVSLSADGIAGELVVSADQKHSWLELFSQLIEPSAFATSYNCDVMTFEKVNNVPCSFLKNGKTICLGEDTEKDNVYLERAKKCKKDRVTVDLHDPNNAKSSTAATAPTTPRREPLPKQPLKPSVTPTAVAPTLPPTTGSVIQAPTAKPAAAIVNPPSPPKPFTLPKSNPDLEKVAKKVSAPSKASMDFATNFLCINAGFVIKKKKANDVCGPARSKYKDDTTHPPTIYACGGDEPTICNPILFGLKTKSEPFCVSRKLNKTATKACNDKLKKNGKAGVKAETLAKKHPAEYRDLVRTAANICHAKSPEDLKKINKDWTTKQTKDLFYTCAAFAERFRHFLPIATEAPQPVGAAAGK
jgi:hypothetical protein